MSKKIIIYLESPHVGPAIKSENEQLALLIGLGG
jgi:hypothetical protein